VNTVYDTTVVAYANGDLRGRQNNNALDKRLRRLEEFVCGRRVAWYNTRLLNEYTEKVREHRNDVIVAFVTRLAEHGRRAARNNLSRQNYARATQARWPKHDQHLLAAAVDAGAGTVIFVTEDYLSNCAAQVRERLGVVVTKT
jgi:hypothetical protein